MTISATAIGEIPLAAQPAASATSTGKPPRRRSVVAKADAVQQPEAR